MKEPAGDRARRRLLIAVIAGGLTLLLLVGFGVYGLLRGPSNPAGDPAPHGSPPAAAAPGPSGTTMPGPEAIPALGDPKTFARRVAEALFTWDSAVGKQPADYAQVLSDVADDSEPNAVASDVRSYLPSPDAWTQLRRYQTRQWLTIDSAVVPEAWATAQAQAAPGQLPRGATAYTITGTRHRTGIWRTEPVEASRPVSFTVFIACTPVAPEFRAKVCRLVRLSELDNPLR